MKVTPVKTEIVHVGDDLFHHLSSIPQLQENSIVVVTSKIVSLCEGSVSPFETDKDELVRQESEFFLERTESQYQLMLTIKNHALAVNAGIDESNSDGQYVLWPKDAQTSANQIWAWLREKFNLKNVGVIISDSKTFPLQWGVIGTSLAHCGFQALHDYRGQPDLFGREMKMSQANLAEALAVAAVIEMGEASEGTPVAIIEDVKHIEFQSHPPTEEELADLAIELEDDAYAPILTKADWKKGKH